MARKPTRNQHRSKAKGGRAKTQNSAVRSAARKGPGETLNSKRAGAGQVVTNEQEQQHRVAECDAARLWSLETATETSRARASVGAIDTSAETAGEIRSDAGYVLGGTAAMAGSLVALGTVPLMAPVLLAGSLVAAAGHIAGVLLGAPMSVGRKHNSSNIERLDPANLRTLAEDDLKSREYRDEDGVIHHHTRTYLRDHAAIPLSNT